VRESEMEREFERERVSVLKWTERKTRQNKKRIQACERGKERRERERVCV
jgi:hypothetical protein